jgi:hypothetical protein
MKTHLANRRCELESRHGAGKLGNSADTLLPRWRIIKQLSMIFDEIVAGREQHLPGTEP